MPDLPRIRVFFDGGGCLWANGDQAIERFGFGPLDVADYDLDGTLKAPPRLRLSVGLRAIIAEAVKLHETYLNADDPSAPSRWGPAEHDRFRRLVDALLCALRAELGAEIAFIDTQPR